MTAAVAAALLLSGCSKNSASPTEPIPTGNIAGAWTGTYFGISFPCNTNAAASIQQTGSAVQGTMTCSCLVGQQFAFNGTLNGNTFAGTANWGGPEFYPLKGTLGGSWLEITILDDSESGGKPMGQLSLRR